MALTFHNRKGSLVTLSNENRTAQRNHPAQEFNNGVIMSSEPLQDNHLFEVRLDRKINSWSGSIEIGVTTCDPNNLEFPSSATDLREGSWIMSGSSILKDGRAVIEEYGHDLDQLCEGDKVAVMRTSDGCLHFFVNGIDQGQAGSDIPPRVFVVVDMYGKCAQVTITDSADAEDRILSNVIRNENTLANSASQLSDRLRFHERCGSLIKLSNNNRTAERRRPLDEFNNGVVMTHRQLRENELFEIRLDRLVDKWSGSIEVGITTHNPANLEFPATMTNMRSGTIMMSGCGILTNGKGTRREYGEYNLDELKEGDRIGLMRKSNGTLHYFINGFDQGVASSRTPNIVFGVVDLYGMAVKVTIVDNEEATIVENNVTGHINNSLLREQLYSVNNDSVNLGDTEKLLFHTRCGSHAAVINNGRTAHRPNASEEFNNGVILSNRPLKNNELFEVRIDKMVDKWVGSIEIGVTTHTPLSVEFPFTMTNIRSGTWMMTGKGVMHNGTTVLDEYGQNLDSLKVGDRVGVLRKENGSLHFFVNNRDQGVAATNLPEKVYAVLDLFGQAAQATLIDQEETFQITDGNISSAGSTNSDQLHFHHLHGRNSTIINNGLTAVRPNAHGEFNDAIVMSNRPLREGEMFEVIIEKMVDRWSGSIEAGVTAIKPEDIEFPNTMTDIDYDTWMLGGSAVMQDGSTIRNGYKCDLDTLGVGSRIGMMRHSDATLHYYINGEDQGMACTDIPPEIYAVIDLYGQCAQVSIVQSTLRQQTENHIANEETEASISLPPSAEVTHRFSQCCGKNITLRNNGCTACRIRNFDHGLVFSSLPLKPDELFEIKIDQLAKQWSGSLQIGLTSLPISDSYSVSNLPATALELRSKATWLMCGSQIKKNGVVIRDNYGPSLDRLEVGTRIGVKYCTNGTMHICINGEDLGICANNIPKKVFAIVDAYGVADMVTIVSSSLTDSVSLSRPPSIHSDTTSDVPEHDEESISKEPVNQEFHENYGRNIQLINSNMSARRTASYNQGIVVCSKPLPREQLFQVRIDKLNPRWTSSLLIGIIGWSPEKLLFPMTASGMKKLSWIICRDSLFYNGVKVKEHYGPNLDCLQVGHLIGVKIDICNCLHLYVNGVDHGVAAKDIPKLCYALVDLYGQCEQVSITTPNETVILCNEVFPPQECNKEKVDKDEGKKEKICRTSEEPAVVKNCEYQNLCSRFKATLSLPDGYFNSDYNLCYCENCLKLRGDEAYHKRGDPPREYAIPFGWCRFMIRIPPKVENLNILEKWHVAYHGTIIGAIRKILDHGEILLPSDITFGGNIISLYSKHQIQKNKSKDLEMTQIILSPTVQYSGNEVFSPRHEYIDPRTKKKSQARVAFQVFARPGSYKVGPQSIGANEPIDQRIGNNDIEWTTKERGSTVLYALLIKIEV